MFLTFNQVLVIASASVFIGFLLKKVNVSYFVRTLQKMWWLILLKIKMIKENITFEEAQLQLILQKAFKVFRIQKDGEKIVIGCNEISLGNFLNLKTIHQQSFEGYFIGVKKIKGNLTMIIKRRSQGYDFIPVDMILEETVRVF